MLKENLSDSTQIQRFRHTPTQTHARTCKPTRTRDKHILAAEWGKKPTPCTVSKERVPKERILSIKTILVESNFVANKNQNSLLTIIILASKKEMRNRIHT